MNYDKITNLPQSFNISWKDDVELFNHLITIESN